MPGVPGELIFTGRNGDGCGPRAWQQTSLLDSASHRGMVNKAWMRALAAMLALPVMVVAFAGCVVVGGSTGGGWFIWPGGGVGLLFVILFVLFLLRRRR